MLNNSRRIMALMVVLVMAFAVVMLVAQDNDTIETRITEAEQTWEAQAVDGYILQFESANAWNMVTSTVVVRDDVVSSLHVSCTAGLIPSGHCSIPSLLPHESTVAGLFALITDTLVYADADELAITYDETYAFPSVIRYTNPEVLDGDWSVRVQRFETIAPDEPLPLAHEIITTNSPYEPTTEATTITFDPVEIAVDDNLEAEIDRLETDWEAQEINDYDLSFVSGSAPFPLLFGDVRVIDNRPVEVALYCEANAPALSCMTHLNLLGRLTMDSLFDVARQITDLSNPADIPQAFDSTYGIPLDIVVDDDEVSGAYFFNLTALKMYDND